MMNDIIVTKLIALDGARIKATSSVEEMQNFVVNKVRPDFADDDILCIKFLISTDESLEDAEETSWFINPIYAENIPELSDYNVDEETEFEFIDYLGFSPNQSYGPKMASEFLPELLFLIPFYEGISILQKYSEFRNSELKYNPNFYGLTDDEKYNLFTQVWLPQDI